MKTWHRVTAAGSLLLLVACTGKTPAGKPTPESTTSAAAELPHSGAPKVGDPLPATVLAGNPCETALTTDQLAGFLGKTTTPTPSDGALGAGCDWNSASGSGAGITVGYDTKNDQGLSLVYQNEKPKAARWETPEPVQGYPAVGYLDTSLDDSKKLNCVIVVGISDSLTYSVALVLGDNAAAQGKDACVLGRDVADAVLTNLKARA